MNVAHLFHRPQEIIDILHEDRAEQFTPAHAPTFAFPLIDDVYEQLGGPDAKGPEVGPIALRKYRILNSFRPWWHSQRWLPPELRPVDLDAAIAVFLAILLGGLGLTYLGGRRLAIEEKR
jgi:hypothetical protein